MLNIHKFNCALLFGPPGSGKGLQGKILGDIPGIIHSSMGDVFRNLDKNSPTGKQFIQYASTGQLVPCELTIRIWKENIEQMIQAKKYIPDRDLLLLDGIPRTVDQAEQLQDELNVEKIIHLDVPDKQTLIERISKRNLIEGRADDANPKVIQNRLEVYKKETFPVINYYPKKVIQNIDASLTPAEVLAQILDALIPLLN